MQGHSRQRNKAISQQGGKNQPLFNQLFDQSLVAAGDSRQEGFKWLGWLALITSHTTQPTV